MSRPLSLFGCLMLVLAFPWLARAQNTNGDGNVEKAITEGVRRQELTKGMQLKLAEAQAAQKRGEIEGAAKYYDEAFQLGQKVGSGIDQEMKQAVTGVVDTRTQLVRQAQRRMDFAEADLLIKRMLSVDPKNPQVLHLKKENDEAWRVARPMLPNPEIREMASEIYTNKMNAASLVQDGRFLYESGRMEEATKKLKQALKLDPENKGAGYYLELISGRKYGQLAREREIQGKSMLLDVENQWAEAVFRERILESAILPDWPNSYARTNMVNTSSSRQAIYEKMRRIKYPVLSYSSVPLADVVKDLVDQAQKGDAEAKGVNILLGSFADSAGGGAAAPQVDAATGLPMPGGGAAADLSTVNVSILPMLRNVTLEQALDIVVKTADKPIKYSVEDWGIIFSARVNEPTPLYVRTFKIDPNTFHMGLAGVQPMMFGMTQNQGGSSSGSGGGGGYGGGGSRGGMSGGMGGGMSGGMGGGMMGGMGGMGGMMGGMGSMGNSATFAGVNIAGGGMMGGMGGYGGGGMGGMGGVAGRGGAGGAGGGRNTGMNRGLEYLTTVTDTEQLATLVRNFFATAGVDLSSTNKAVFFNDRLGVLMVKASLADLDIVERAVQVLNMAPPQVTIKAKFLEITQNDNKALGFNWYLGNTLMRGGGIGLSGGTAPSYVSPNQSTAANPSGVFPGPGASAGQAGPYATLPAATDGNLTAGLRNSAPALATVTGILTDPQFRMVINALEQRDGVDLLACPEVTTLSGRQTQVKVVDVRYIVTDLSINQTTSGGGNTGTGGVTLGGGGVGSTVQPIAEGIEVGPTLDVVPYVTADGYTIQMAIIPTLKEFVGYDDAGAFVAQIQSVGSSVAAPLVAPTPLPKFRLRTVATQCIVWDGQTVVLGGLIAENVTKTKDKVPMLGDMPLIGRFFRSEANNSQKKNLMIFVTPRIIDPAGNPVHSDDEMPFAKANVPEQSKQAVQ